ncbi:MAG: hypothetical protein NVSMB29_16460 [Candidatus Dormibacteria bacterium]
MPDSAARPSVQVVEDALRKHHVLELGYAAKDGRALSLRIEPLAIRFNTAGHRVLWAWDLGAGHIEQLLLSGIGSATDTGQSFTPRQWQEEADRAPA